MEMKRLPLRGVINIVRFNYPFYLLAITAGVLLIVLSPFLPPFLHIAAQVFASVSLLMVILSLTFSYIIYDRSRLYELYWLPVLNDKKVLNLTAGFDETSRILLDKYPGIRLTVCDFYNPARHTEPSIKRARNIHPPMEGTLMVETQKLPFQNGEFDACLAILSAHEIRNDAERIRFFRELHRVTDPVAKIYVTEHVRDLNNFLAYSIGAFHFHSRSTWINTFEKAGFRIAHEIRTAGFISTFILHKNGDTF